MFNSIDLKTIFISLFISGSICSVESKKTKQDSLNIVESVRLLINKQFELMRSDIKKLNENVAKLEYKITEQSLTLKNQTILIDKLVESVKTTIDHVQTRNSWNRYETTRRKRSIRRFIVGRSISNERNHDEYTNEFRGNDDSGESRFKLSNELVENVIGWQNRTDLRLTKMMNVIAEIFKEDKQLSLDLSKLNERQANEDRTELVERMRKEFKEQFSINKIELKNYISNVNENCLRTKTQNENLTFLLLGIKDDLINPLKNGNKLSQENSVLQPDDEMSLADTSSLTGKTTTEQFCKSSTKLMNNTIELFRTELNNVKQQIISKLDRENTRINERIFTLNNNYQHLNNLKNCNSNINVVRSNSVDESNLNESIEEKYNEMDSQSLTRTQNSNRNNPTAKPFVMSTSPTSTFVAPFHPQPRRQDEDMDTGGRSKSNKRIKLINPIRYDELERRNCHKNSRIAPANCEELWTDRVNCDGVYVIMLRDEAVRVYCEIDHDAGNTVIMRRGQFDGHQLTMFNRNWNDYKKGFGEPDADFWLGLDRIHELTKNQDQMLIIDLETFSGEQMTLKYNEFYVENELNNYRLKISEPTGENSNYANSFLSHHGASFSTFDRNSPYNCARKFAGGWWYFNNNQCHNVLLNGVFYRNSTPMHKDGIQWESKWPKKYLKSVQMKIRPKKFT